jgi:hypothetical protein
MRIDKTLTINNNHITCETMLALHIEPWVNKFWFIKVFPMGEYGKFIFIDKDDFEDACEIAPPPMPEDLCDVIRFAVSKKCSILCLDPDGDRVNELRYYDD